MCIHSEIKIHIESKQNPVLNDPNTNPEMYLKWGENNIQNFKDLILNNQNLLNDITSSIEISDTDQVVEQFTSFIKDHAFKVFGKTRYQHDSKQKQYNKKQWFNHECYNARSKYKKSRNAYLKNKTDEKKNRHIFITYKNKYNKIKKTSKK